MAYSSIVNKMLAGVESANRANELRYQQAMSIYDDIISRSSKGGAFEKASLAGIEKQKTKGVGAATQHMIGSGLYGTTTAANLGKMWESDVSGPARLKLEDVMEQRRSSALRDQAGLIERKEDVGPSYSDIASLSGSMGSASYAPQQTTPEHGTAASPYDVFGRPKGSFMKGSNLLYPTGRI